MTMGLVTATRTSRAQQIIDDLGANCKLKFYNGTQPATGASPGAAVLLGTLNFVSFGVASAGVITLGAATQNSALHVSGTPTWARASTSADAAVADFAIPADLTFAGTIATGVDIDLLASTITEGNV